MRHNLFFVLFSALILVGCQRNSFRIEGVIEGAEPSAKLYLEHVALVNSVVIDSTELGKDGSFSFKHERPEYPDLYRLRVEKKSILLAVDSLETITVHADIQDVLNASFDGSPKSETIAALRRSLRDSALPDHKDFARKTIMENPSSVVAYYALFQNKNGVPVFDLADKADKVYFQAVATSWNVWMPENPRTKVLYQQVLEQINAERRQINSEIMQAFIDEQENTFLDIVLPDQYGDERALSEFRGKVILLDFTSMAIDGYQNYIFSLRERYNKYHAKGLEIYQVYPDQNRLVWEEQVDNLPWTTVRTEEGLASRVYATYNVSGLPTLYLINKKGEAIKRFVGFQGLDEAIEAAL